MSLSRHPISVVRRGVEQTLWTQFNLNAAFRDSRGQRNLWYGKEKEEYKMRYVLTAICMAGLVQYASATEITVTFSEDFATELQDEYGEREGKILTKRIEKDLLRAFEKEGVSPERVDVTIVDAKPNRPTFEQMSANLGLDGFRSISLGGMKLEGTAFGADDAVLATQSYKFFESDIRLAIGSGVWTDARRASKGFAKRLADDIGS